jgi:hypothetical protein
LLELHRRPIAQRRVQPAAVVILLDEAPTSDHLKVKVSGDIDGDTIKVASMKLQ